MWNVSVRFFMQLLGLLVPGFALSTVSAVLTAPVFFEFCTVCSFDEEDERGVTLISSTISISGVISDGSCCVVWGMALFIAA